MVEAAYTPLVVLLVVVLVTGHLLVGIFVALGMGTLVSADWGSSLHVEQEAAGRTR